MLNENNYFDIYDKFNKRVPVGGIGMLDPHVGLGIRGYPKSHQHKKTQTKRDYRVIFLNRVAVAAWKQRQDEYTFNLIKI